MKLNFSMPSADVKAHMTGNIQNWRCCMSISSMLGDAQLRGDVQGPAEAEATGYSQFDSIGR